MTESPFSIPSPCDGCQADLCCCGDELRCDDWREWATATYEEWRQRSWASMLNNGYCVIDICPC